MLEGIVFDSMSDMKGSIPIAYDAYHNKYTHVSELGRFIPVVENDFFKESKLYDMLFFILPFDNYQELIKDKRGKMESKEEYIEMVTRQMFAEENMSFISNEKDEKISSMEAAIDSEYLMLYAVDIKSDRYVMSLPVSVYPVEGSYPLMIRGVRNTENFGSVDVHVGSEIIFSSNVKKLD